MNNKNQLKTVLAMSVIIATILSVNINIVNAEIFMPYGSVGQEDQLYAQDANGLYYVNFVPSQGNGLFAQVNEINDIFTHDGAIKTFGIYEDTEAFIYEPSINGQYTNVLFMYELNDISNNFELTSIHKDVSGLNVSLTQLENSK